MNDSIPNTVCCLLCRGTIIYKDGDKARFKAHMNNEHGAFFDLDYLLASSMMEQDQKDTVARTIKPGAGLPAYQEYQGHPGPASYDQETLRETTHTDVGYQGVGVSSSSFQTQSSMKRDRLEYETELLINQINQSDSYKPITPQNQPIKKEEVHDDQTSSYNNDPSDQSSYQHYPTDQTSYDSSSIDANAEPNHQDAMNVANDVSMKDDDAGTEKERFYCQFEGCGKSYSNAANRATHQRKAHGIVGPRAAKKQKMSVSSIPEDEIVPSSTEVAGEPSEDINDDSPAILEDNNSTGGSFLTDTSLGFDESSDVDNDNDVFKTDAPVEEVQTSTAIEAEKSEAVQAIDLSSSKYFDKNPKVIATARGKSLLLFDEIPEGLPSGWKQRNFEVTNKQTGDKSVLKHYLAPEQKVLKTGLAVVEYLRVKGDLDHDALVDIAKKLNIADKKFKSLFN